MQIIHLSDTHFGNSKPAFDPERLKHALNELKKLFVDEDTYMVISGDITLQGNPYGYKLAEEFFRGTWLTHGGSPERFLACPGNHDLCENSFNNFDSFLYAIRRDNKFDFSKNSCGLISFEHVTFLLVNSAYHLDHNYGLVDYKGLRKVLEENHTNLAETRHRVAVVHHHLLGIQSKDTSTIRNAFLLIALLDKYKFNLVLHGHRHSQASLIVGTAQMKIFSTRSFNFPTSGIVNGVSIISYDQGNWERSELVLSGDNSPTNGLAFHTVEK